MKEEQEGWGGPSSYLVYNPTSVSSFGLLWAHPDSKITISSYFTYRKEARPCKHFAWSDTDTCVNCPRLLKTKGTVQTFTARFVPHKYDMLTQLSSS